jgi:hypothetical protein
MEPLHGIAETRVDAAFECSLKVGLCALSVDMDEGRRFRRGASKHMNPGSRYCTTVGIDNGSDEVRR